MYRYSDLGIFKFLSFLALMFMLMALVSAGFCFFYQLSPYHYWRITLIFFAVSTLLQWQIVVHKINIIEKKIVSFIEGGGAPNVRLEWSRHFLSGFENLGCVIYFSMLWVVVVLGTFTLLPDAWRNQILIFFHQLPA